MKKALILTAIVAAFAIPTAAHADGSSVSADANCDTFTIHIAGLQPGDSVMVGEGSQPPFGFTMGGPTYFQFAIDEQAGTAVTHLPIDTYEATHGYEGVVQVNDVTMFRQVVNCAPEPAPIEQAVAVADPPVPAPEQLAAAPVVVELFADVAFAPPW